MGSANRLFLAALVSTAAVVGCYGSSENDKNSASGGSSGSAGSSAGRAGKGSGGAAQAGSGGVSNWPPPAPTTAPSAVDLLFVIDNSISMADKQKLLRDAVPELVRRFITPNCVDDAGGVVGVSDSLGNCVAGTAEFAAVADLHLGVISSSLGTHGGQVCDPAMAIDSTVDDKAELLPSVRGLSSWNDQGFLAWDPAGTANAPPGEANSDTLVSSFQDHLLSAGEHGCGYEATLEAWYRFLIDPAPPASVVLDPNTMQTSRVGINQTILAQRAAFLRPDSLLGIIMLSDENDCSIVDEGSGWLVGMLQNGGTVFNMPRATSACIADPNSLCCRSCAVGEASPPQGCTALATDSECMKGLTLTTLEDSVNLRCFAQKRRFGFDLLHPIGRYVNGLSNPTVPDAADQQVQNPLFADGRHPSRVLLAAAVGVPWQDIADDASLSGAGLRFQSASELTAQGRWELILGDPELGVDPTDPLMIEAIDPRTGTHPLLGIAIAPETSTNPQENLINGHEQVATRRDDLQYACIFPLSVTRDCSNPETTPCDCGPDNLDRNRPVCQPLAGGAAGTTQYWAKAYPGIRHLQLLRAMGEQAVVASVCPKIVDGQITEPSYGYNPVATAIADQAAPILRGP